MKSAEHVQWDVAMLTGPTRAQGASILATFRVFGEQFRAAALAAQEALEVIGRQQGAAVRAGLAALPPQPDTSLELFGSALIGAARLRGLPVDPSQATRSPAGRAPCKPRPARGSSVMDEREASARLYPSRRSIDVSPQEPPRGTLPPAT